MEITNVCNLTCSMCPRSLAGVNVGQPRAVLPERAWAEVVRAGSFIDTITLNGLSENFLHPRFLDLVEEIEETGTRVVFSTNGTLIGAEEAERIGRLRRIHAINVSIDSADPAEYRRIRGDALERAKAGIEDLVAATRGSVHITASAVVMKMSRGGLTLLPAFLSSVGVNNRAGGGDAEDGSGLGARRA